MNFLRNLALTLLGLAFGLVAVTVVLLTIFWLVDGCIGTGCK